MKAVAKIGAMLLAMIGLCALGFAQSDPGGSTNGAPLMSSWSFGDITNWFSDRGYPPVFFTNISSSLLGDGTAAVVDGTNAASLQYFVFERDGTTNLTVDVGSLALWFAPSWSGTNEGGAGPGGFGRLIEVGSTNGGGRWSLYVDPEGVNIYFAAQTNGGPPVTYLSAPINWTTNYWHCLALTYSATNTVLYIDGGPAATGPGLTNYPGPDVLTNGFFIGSDNAGNNRAGGMFDDIHTYNFPISWTGAMDEFFGGILAFLANPLNAANFVRPAVSAPSSSPSYYNVVSGAGYMQYLGATTGCAPNASVWITNISVTKTSQPITLRFTIAGGTSGWLYDVFAAPALTVPLTNAVWSWLGQGVSCAVYSIPGLPTNAAAMFILGSPLDSDGDGLTDAYERLVSHSDPYKMDTDGNKMPDGWQVLHFGGIGNNPNSDPDRDGLTNLKEYLYGTDPNKSEGVTVWVGFPSGATALP